MRFTERHDWHSDDGQFRITQVRATQFEVSRKSFGSSWWSCGCFKTLDEAKRHCRHLAKFPVSTDPEHAEEDGDMPIEFSWDEP